MASTASWLVPVIVGAGSTAATAYINSRNARRDREAAADEREEDRELSDEQHLRNIAFQESMADPFRHQMSQGRNLTALDMISRLGMGGGVTPPSNVAPYMGRVSAPYTPGADLQRQIEQIRASIAGGQTAPTMTDPANYGRTSVLNLNAPTGSAGTVPAPGAAGTAVGTTPITDYFTGYERRNEGPGGWSTVKERTAQGSMGGPWGAAGGFVGGLVEGAFTRNARSAMTDFSVDDARRILEEVYRRELGRTPSRTEVDTHLANQGLKPGGEWVGEAGLAEVIRNIQEEARRAQRAGRAA